MSLSLALLGSEVVSLVTAFLHSKGVAGTLSGICFASFYLACDLIFDVELLSEGAEEGSK